MERTTIFFFAQGMTGKFKTCKRILNDLLFSHQSPADKKSSNKWHRCGISNSFLIVHSATSGEELKIPVLNRASKVNLVSM